ncbi:MAG: DNA helicase II [Rickettsiales bacterium]|nr:DNA helicase II [Rickettsiales bacterium]
MNLISKDEKIEIPEPDFLNNLNNQQKKAIINTEGPLLVLSGAGTGKTKVLTTRLAHIIYSRRANIKDILCVTFTNKAALEMKLRVEKLIKSPVEGMFIGTFHSIGARFLRKHSEYVGLKNNFTILDKDDQLRLIKQICISLDLDTKIDNPKSFSYMIDQMKNHGLSFDHISNHEYEKKTSGRLSQIYKLYQDRLQNYNAVDFGDLIMLPLKILKDNGSILNQYQEKFKYILVDEYQDTNASQYMLLRLLAGSKQNICCVGDEDQSIYGWRGAQLKNILNFENDFKKSIIIRLEQNYRSTGNILLTASSLISENKERIGKKLWTSDPDGEPVVITNLENDEMEAIFVAKVLKELKKNGVSPSQIAILTRASFQFKDIEDRFIRENIKYKVVGGLRFYERSEIKDALAYFRILVNESDNLSLERIINNPRRGVGKVMLQKLYSISNNKGISLLNSLEYINQDSSVTKNAQKNINNLIAVLRKHIKLLAIEDHSDVAGSLLDDVGYTSMLQNEKTPEAEGKLENLKKLIVDIKNRSSINEFLEEVSLLSDNANDEINSEKVSLMTLHSAKGLEFDYVFLPGWEEGIFPNQRNIDEYGNKGLEEERRLAYVGITRARKLLNISFVNFRKQYNYSLYRSIPSRFISELPKKSCKVEIEKEKSEKKYKKLDTFSSDIFKVGDSVFHEEYGKGIILGINGKKLQVKFSDSSDVINIFSDFVKKN